MHGYGVLEVLYNFLKCYNTMRQGVNIYFCIIKVKEVMHCYYAPNVQMSNCEFTAKAMAPRFNFCVCWGRGRPGVGGGG